MSRHFYFFLVYSVQSNIKDQIVDLYELLGKFFLHINYVLLNFNLTFQYKPN
jgi:hypothetical protein